MTPFATAYFFYAMAALLLPAVVLGLLGKPLQYYVLFVTLAFVPLIYNTWERLLYLGIFYLFSLLTAFVYLKLKKKQGAVFWCFLALALAPLLLSKFGTGFHLMGISYITFRAVQWIIGIHEGKIERIGIVDFTCFVLFFPTLSAGPIDRLQRFTRDLHARHGRDEYLALLRAGIWKLFHGLLYSFAIAPVIQLFLLERFAGGRGPAALAGYAYAYTLYLFFNFAGYSSLAVGASYLLGIKTPDNFNFPFASRDLKEFWARWHMSLSTFFRDTIYNRFVMASLKGKWFKNPRAGSYLGYLLTMLVMGLWHGPELHFLVYGIYHGALLCLNDWLDSRKGFKRFKNSRYGGLLCAFVTFHAVVFGLLIFSGRMF